MKMKNTPSVYNMACDLVLVAFLASYGTSGACRDYILK